MIKGYLVIPLAGLGQRFVDKGYSLPKQLLPINGITTLEYSLDSIDVPKDFQVIILARSSFFTTYDLRPIFKKKFGNNVKFLEVFEKTRGSLETCLLAEKIIKKDVPLHIFTLDVNIYPKIDLSKISFENVDGNISIVKINNKNFSYVDIDKANFVSRTIEKVIISNWGITGLYSFKSSKLFFQISKKYINNNINKLDGEFYLAPIYNEYIKKGFKVTTNKAWGLYCFGTPSEYEWCKAHIKGSIQTIGVATDHSGYFEKERFTEYLKKLNFKVFDVGCFSNADCDYPDYVNTLCDLINKKFVDIGFSFCRSGQGVNIAANKNPGILSVIYLNNDDFKKCLEHNNPNHISIPSEKIDNVCEKEFIEVLKNTVFEGGRHQDRLSSMT